MILEQLLSFCKEGYNLDKFSKPFSDDQYTYVTNRSVIIRVDKLNEVPDPPPISIDCLKHYFNCVPAFSMPEIKVKKVVCSKCGGSGKLTKCPECEGAGIVEWNNEYHSYEDDCKTCDGKSVIPEGKDDCKNCGGSGKADDPLQSIEMNGVNFSPKTLELVSKLTNVLFFVRPNHELATFSFDGGMGIVASL